MENKQFRREANNFWLADHRRSWSQGRRESHADHRTRLTADASLLLRAATLCSRAVIAG